MILVLAGLQCAALATTATAAPTPPAEWHTWVLDSPGQFRLGPPPTPNSEKTATEIAQLLRLQKDRTRAMERAVRFWNGPRPSVRWTKVGLRQIVLHRPGAFPTRSARILSLLHVGMYEAYVAARDSKSAYNRARPAEVDDRIHPLFETTGSAYPDPNSAIAGAAERLLIYLFPQEPPETFTEMADEAVKSRLWAGVNYRSDIKRGRRLGHRVAELVVARGEADGHKLPWDFADQRLCSTENCAGADENYWRSTPPVFQYPPTDPMASKWDTWVLESPDQFRPPPPPSYGSPEFLEELEQVRLANDESSPEDKALAFFWDDGPGSFSPAGHWNDIAIDVTQSRDARIAKTLRTFALMNVAITDAFIAAWDAKYHYWSIRPVTAMRRETISGQPNPSYEPGWTPNLVTPPFPSYVSGHASESAAAARVLQYFFPDTGRSSQEVVGSLGASGSIDEIAEQVALSRLIGGIHFPSDNEAALILGREIAAEAIDQATN